MAMQAADALEAAQADKMRIAREQFTQICSCCGWEAEASGASWDELQAHIKVCPKHPVSRLTKELEAAQAENDELVTALAVCRDVFPVPVVGTELDDWYVSAISFPLAVPEYVKASLGASPQPSQARELIPADVAEKLTDAAYEWSNYVEADHAPRTLLEHMQKAIAAINAKEHQNDLPDL